MFTMNIGASQTSQNQPLTPTEQPNQQQQDAKVAITTSEPSPATASVSKGMAPAAIETSSVVKQLHSEVINHVAHSEARSQPSASPQPSKVSSSGGENTEVVHASKRVAALYMSEKLQDEGEVEPDETVAERVTLKDWDPVSWGRLKVASM